MAPEIERNCQTSRFLAQRRVCFVFIMAMLFLTLPAWIQASGHPDDIYWDPTFGLPGAQTRVGTIFIDGDDVYVGGWFNNINNIPGTSGIARWDGTSWHALGEGVNGVVGVIAMIDGKLYIGGDFLTAGGVLCNHIAWWDGAQWHAMGGGIKDIFYSLPVTDIEFFNGDIYVGGGFPKAGNKTVYGIARWDGSEWHDLEGGLSTPGDLNHFSSASGLAADENYLYVAGNFLRAGELAVDNFAKWDGAQWLHPNTFTRGGVRSMAMVGSDLYIGGWFTFSASNGVANNIARWDGTRWYSLGGGTNELVLSVWPVGGELYAAGNFSRAGGVTVNRIAKWDGTYWNSLGSGLELKGWNFAVAARENGEVFAGGDFHTAGGTPSMHIARWFNPVPYPSRPYPGHKTHNHSTAVLISWDVSGPPNPPSGYDVYLGTTSDPSLVAQDQPGQFFDPGGLEFSTTYYWRIVPKDGSGNFATGSLWQFTTEDEVTSRLVVSSAASHCRIFQTDTVSIDILLADNPIPIDAGGLDISYDPILLTFLTCEPGSLTSSWQHLEGADLGSTIRIGGYHTEAIPESSSGEFARLKFLANCCFADSGQTVSLIPFNLIDDLAGLDPVSGEFRCDNYTPDGDPNFDGLVTSGDALCAFEAYLSSPDAPLGSCGEPGWDVRGDVDCSGFVTPADALCIFEFWDNGSCMFCEPSPPARSGRSVMSPAIVTIRTTQSEQQYLTVIVRVAGVTSLEAFGFELSYPADKLEYITTIRTPLSLEFNHLGSTVIQAGRLRQGGYIQEPVNASSQSDLVELRFKIISPGLAGTITLENFVDDLAGADPVSCELTAAGDHGPVFERFILYQNYPNPFNPGTEIRYEIPDGQVNVPVQLTIYNIEGKLVRALVNARQNTGAYQVRWNGQNQLGEEVSSGVYFYVLKAGSIELTRKLVRLK